jgi:hypothetical protein
LPEAISFKLCGHGRCIQHGVISFFGFGWRYVADGLQKATVVEPVDPFQSGEFHRFEVPPWSAPMDDLGLVETVDRFGEGIIITVADTPTDGSMPASASRSEYRMDTY